VANQIKKFIILTGGYLQLPGDNVIYVESGPENEGRKHFTDAVAQAIVDENPGYLGTLIGINPNYDQAATAQATSDDRDEQIKTLTIERDSAKAVADSKTEVVEKLTADRNTTLSDLESKTKELDSVKAELKSDRTKLTKANNEVTRLTAENVKMATELTALQEQLKQVTSTPVEPNPSANA
jgi:myosin heavy subunit